MGAMRVATIVMAVVLGVASVAKSQAAAKPNILFVLIDDMGWPDLRCYGHKFHETPRIDALASQGVRFTDFYATPVCSSTRGTIETGQNSARVGITDFLPGHYKKFAKLVVPAMPDHLDHALTTPGEALGAAGYLTGYFGKWHLGWGAANAPGSHGYQVNAANLGKPFREWRGDKPNGPKDMDLITDQAIYILREHAAKSGKPFFLHVSHHAVHIPIQGNESTISKYADKAKPTTGVNHPVYAAMVEDLDTQVGRLLDTLDELGMSENTVVIVTSDNGGLGEAYTGTGQVVSTNEPLRGEKGMVYEGGVRVPFIVRWPGVAPAGVVCREPAAMWDMLPTFCAIAGVANPDQPIDGVNLTPVFRDPNADLGREAIYIHYPHYHHSTPATAVRMGDWKLIEWYETGALSLFNLRDDPSETTNLSARRPDRAAAMLAKIEAWRERVGAKLPTANPLYDPERADVWWDRRTDAPLDLKAMGDRLEERASKPYFRSR